MLQNATPCRKSASWPPNISEENISSSAPATRNTSLQILFKRPTHAVVFELATTPLRFTHFWQGAQSLAPAMQNHILMAKSGPRPSAFNPFDFQTCFAPQHRALFQRLKFQKWSTCLVFFNHLDLKTCFPPQRRALFQQLNAQKLSKACFVPLGNLLRATAACNFWYLIWPDGSAPAALTSLLFDPPEPQNIRKTECFAAFLHFRPPGPSFYWHFLFRLFLISDCSHLCFSICPYCRKFDF